jgi:hypothetical protein
MGLLDLRKTLRPKPWTGDYAVAATGMELGNEALAIEKRQAEELSRLRLTLDRTGLTGAQEFDLTASLQGFLLAFSSRVLRSTLGISLADRLSHSMADFMTHISAGLWSQANSDEVAQILGKIYNTTISTLAPYPSASGKGLDPHTAEVFEYAFARSLAVLLCPDGDPRGTLSRYLFHASATVLAGEEEMATAIERLVVGSLSSFPKH